MAWIGADGLKSAVRSQIAGDLLPPLHPGGINKEGLIATGLLAIADFVPGDVDKDQMIEIPDDPTLALRGTIEARATLVPLYVGASLVERAPEPAAEAPAATPEPTAPPEGPKPEAAPAEPAPQ